MEILERYFPLSNSSVPEFLENVPEVERLLGFDRSKWISCEVGNRGVRAVCELNALALARTLVLDASSFGHISLVTAAARAIHENR